MAEGSSSSSKQASRARDKGKGKAVHGRGAQARHVRREGYEAELRRLEADLTRLDSQTSTPYTKFSDLPLSSATLQGLQSSYFTNLTPVQARSLPHALKGQDVLASARTGSGKTLAFLVPLLEKLHRAKWGPNDGLGALVISPTRELAVQIFEVLRKIGAHHSFSAGLVIGGKNLRDEQERLSRMNILISTPGRLLQHMDQTIAFDTSNVQMLVLDEADRCLDLGFAKTLDAIVANLPPTGPGGRQTLLFSATQSGSIASLARLSLRDPVYVSVRDKEAGSEVTDGEASTSQRRIGDLETPKGLEQHYMVVDLDRKLDILWGFIKSHLACKTLVFMSSCKQVRFVYETFRHLRPGTSLLHIHGKQKQTKRLDIFQKFTSTSHAVLFATDIAARGLDFPSVNWVVQLDCPEDVDTYVHRVGRTARYNSKGKSLLFLLPSEQDGFLQRLKDKKLDELVRPIKINPSKSSVSIQKQFQSLAFRFPEIKFLAQRAFISYTRSVHLQKDKKTFKLDQLPLDKFAAALGLPGAPKIKFVSKQQAAAKKNKERDVEKLKATLRQDSASQSEESDGPDDKYPNDDSVDEVDEIESIDSNDEAAETETRQLDGAPTEDPSAVSINKPLKTTKYDKMYRRQNQGVLSEHYNKVVEHDEEANGSSLLLGADDDQEDFITLARRQHDLPLDHDDSQSMHNGMSTAIGGDEETGMEDLSKRRLKMGMTKKGLVKLRGKGEKLIFDEEGQSHALYEMTREDAIEDVEAERRQFLENEGQRMRSIDVADKAAQKEARRDKKRKRKEREREVDGRDEGAARIAVLGGDSGGEDDSAGREDQTHQDDTEEVDHEHDSRRRSSLNLHDVETAERDEEDAEIDLEALALQALRKKVRR